MTARTLLPELPAYAALAAHATSLESVSLEELFAADNTRAHTFAVSAAGLHLDYSKHRVTAQSLSLLLQLAEQAGLKQGIEDLFNGAHVNNTGRTAPRCTHCCGLPRGVHNRPDFRK
jgi:glucose-6-phosphate isomerase